MRSTIDFAPATAATHKEHTKVMDLFDRYETSLLYVLYGGKKRVHNARMLTL